MNGQEHFIGRRFLGVTASKLRCMMFVKYKYVITASEKCMRMREEFG